MYDDVERQIIINDLEKKELNVCNNVIILLSQGYIVNNRKKAKLDFSSIMIHAIENMPVFDKNRQDLIINLYNRWEVL